MRWGVCLLLWMVGCASPKPDRSASPWQSPSWSGDGLPAATDTAPPTPRDGLGGGSDGGDTGGTSVSALESMYFVDGVFGVFNPDSDSPTGRLALTTEPTSCAEIFGLTGVPNGVYVSLRAESEWIGDYSRCEEAESVGCLFEDFWVLGTDRGELSAEDQLMILDVQPHDVVLEWRLGGGSQRSMTIDHCGDGEAWL